MKRFSLMDVGSLLRPLSDRMPMEWLSQKGHVRPTYYIMDRSWVPEETFKVDMANMWLTQPRQGLTRLARKVEGLCGHLLEFKKQMRG